jgi:hypothetical protein
VCACSREACACVHIKGRGIGFLEEFKRFVTVILVGLETAAPTELARQIVASAHRKGGQLCALSVVSKQAALSKGKMKANTRLVSVP